MNMRSLIQNTRMTPSAKIIFLFIFSISLAFASEHPVSKVIIPKTIPEVFQEIDEYNAALDKMLEMNQLSEVHYHVFAVLELVKALPKLSQHLSPTQLKILQNHIASIKKLATQMDASSDANDYDETQDQYKKLQSLIDELHTYYSIKKHTQ
ncbi:TPA: transporter [Legionella pneumophila]|uniref:Chemiosmotic efflux system C protein A n=1 Tax=Legionella erythra TaxID=448 RepID=A0A0W0TJ53_LEGER|nr:hypothetical protein [Legionella erythra]HAT6349382.1 transporter [Legionella pneumophila]KTC95598.1 chemiosmotic efflux system C protein A [Legionella erythra]HAU0381397.1 transporter [Legionella pneumophila]HAU0422402.1 transporter [Legionella pneumophila]HAU0424814.1 transporter [Legionella pneumophila]